MSYQRRPRAVRQLPPGVRVQSTIKRALEGDMMHGPSWYTAMSGVQSRPPRAKIANVALGSLGDDPSSTALEQPSLANPTVVDPVDEQTRQWQAAVLNQINSGANALERQRWFQIAATLSIPLAAAVWRAILGRRRAKMSV